MNKISAFFVGYYRLSKAKKNELDNHLIEQASFRANICSKCLSDGLCPKCYCDLPAMFFIDKEDSKCPYPKLMDEKEWDLYKKKEKIEIENILENFKKSLTKQ